METTYEYERGSKSKFFIRVFFEFMDIAVNNACCANNEPVTLDEPAT